MGDAMRFQFMGRVLSVAHPSGYPQYFLLSFAWSYFPLPLSLTTKVNLLSAAFTIVAGAIFFSVARQLDTFQDCGPTFR